MLLQALQTFRRRRLQLRNSFGQLGFALTALRKARLRFFQRSRTGTLQERGELLTMRREIGFVVGDVVGLARCDGDRADALDLQRDGLRGIERLAVGESTAVKPDFAGAARQVVQRYTRCGGRQPRLKLGDARGLAARRVDNFVLSRIASQHIDQRGTFAVCGACRLQSTGDLLQPLGQLQRPPVALHRSERGLDRVARLFAFENSRCSGTGARSEVSEQRSRIAGRKLKPSELARTTVKHLQRSLQRGELLFARDNDLLGAPALLTGVARFLEAAPRLGCSRIARLCGIRV